MYRVLCMLLCGALVGCATPGEPPVARNWKMVTIELQDAGWGHGSKEVTPDGAVASRHLTAQIPPWFHQERQQLTANDLAELNRLVVSLGSEALQPADGQPPASAFTAVTVSFDDGSRMAERVRPDRPFRAAAFQSIWELVRRYRTVRGW